MKKTEKNWLQLKRGLVNQFAAKNKTTPQHIVMAYRDLFERHLYDDKLEYIREQLQFLDLDSIKPRGEQFNRDYEIVEYHHANYFD